jgi:hypothetical protein
MSTHNLRIIGILATKVKECQEMLKPLQAKLDQIAPELLCLHEKLVSLRRCIKGAEAKNKVYLSAIYNGFRASFAFWPLLNLMDAVLTISS